MNQVIYCPLTCRQNNAVLSQTGTISIKIHSCIDAIPTHLWDNILPENKIFLSRDYLKACEKQGNGTQYRYASILKNDQLAAVAAFQIFKIDENNGLRLETKPTDGEGTIQNISTKVKNWVKEKINKIEYTTLVLGNPFVTGDHNFYYTDTLHPIEAFDALAHTINQIQAEVKADTMVVKDFELSKIEYPSSLKRFNYQEVAVQPNMEMIIRPEWKTYTDYLASMTSKYRTRAKKARKKGKNIVRKIFNLEDIQQNQVLLNQLYLKLAEKAEFNFSLIPNDYYLRLKQNLGERFQVLAYYIDDQLVGYITYFLFADQMEVHYMGYEESYNRTHYLYQNILYDLVEKAIENQKVHLSLGRTALEIKSTIGAVGHETRFFLKHKNQLTNFVLPTFIKQFGQVEWTPRNPFKE